MTTFAYPNQRYTSNLGLSLFGMDEVLADNMNLIDAAYGAGSSINVNGTLVTSPNLSSTLPPAPPGDQLVTFQFDINGNISAYVPVPAPGGVTSFSGDSVVYNNALSAGAVTLSLISQTANTVFAGPATGSNATPTFRALVAADIPNSANLPLWSNLQNAGGNLTLSNAAFTTTFNQTSAVAWLWANTTVATVSTTNASPLLELAAQYWATGAATGTDLWTIGSTLTAGLNGTSALVFTHTGSTGKAAVQVPLLTLGGVDSGISRIGAASLAIGNGTAGDYSATVYAGIFEALGLTTHGAATITEGDNDHTGYVSWLAQGGGVRTAYMGYDAGGDVTLTIASGALNILGTVTRIGATDTGISRLGAASLAIGNGTAGDTTGNLSFNKVIKYAGVATVGAGVPSLIATIDLTAQIAAIAAGTALYAVPATGAGLYRVTAYAKITTASDISSTLGGAGGFVLTWTDPTDSTTPTAVTFSDQSSQSLTGNTTTTVYVASAVVACKASTNLQYGFGYTDSHTSTAMAYKLSVKVEYLG